MQAMILEDDPTFRAELRALLAWEGLGVLCFADPGPAKAAARSAILDLLVLGERVGGRLAHDVALLAEWRNPGLGLVLLSDRTGDAREELWELLPSLRAVLPARAGAAAVARTTLALARSLAPAGWQDGPEEEGRPFRATAPLRMPACPPEELRPMPGPEVPAPRMPPAPTFVLVPKTAPLSAPRRLHLA